MAIDLLRQSLRAGEYEIKEQLARGGMATVYTAYARSLDTTVAIKVLSPQLAQDPSFLERFHAEATAIAALHHPNIIEVYYFAHESNVAYIAMRYVPGGTLKDRVQTLSGPMDLRTATRLTAQVAAALNYAHERGLVHLDVKPGNVLLGSADWPLLSDFGIIRMAGDIRPEGHRIAGTPAYMSPEQWQGLPLDGRSDQYSLGLMYYELVTGRRPFAGETSAELMTQHLSEPPPRPRELNPGIPGPVEEVMLRALAKRPEDRFPTTGEFGAALSEAVERSRGMQLETKQAIVGAAPNLIALLVLSVFAPLLASLPNADLPILQQLTLNWPVQLLTALLESWLLLAIRWHLIGIVSRLLATVVDALDRFTRLYVRLGTDAEGPLRVRAWRNAVVGSGEGIVNVAYLFVISQLLGPPLIKTVGLALRYGLEDLVATAVAGVILLVAIAIVLRLFRTSGAIAGVIALALCWGFISTLPLVDQDLWNGRLSLQWLAKLAVGLAVLAAFLAVRGRVQRAARALVIPLVDSPLGEIQRDLSPEAREARRQGIGRGVDGIVNVLYLVVGYPIIALSLQEVLKRLIQAEVLVAVLITVGVIVVAALLVNQLRITGGMVSATLGLLICAPMLLGLPLFQEGLLGSASLQWLARLLIGLGVLALFFGIRRRIQAAGRRVIVPAIDRQLGSLVPSQSEAQEASRLRALEGAADALVDVLYLLIGYIAVVGPVAGALAEVGSLSWGSAVIYALFVVAIIFVLFRFVRGVAPALRPAAAPA